MFELHIPPTVVYGGGTRKRIGMLCRNLNIDKPLIISDKYLITTPVVDEVMKYLQEYNIKAALFAEITGEPEIVDVEKALFAANSNGCDGIISVGGGSCIDTGKAVAVMAKNDGNIADFVGYGKVKRPGLPHIALPTTAGTGSEVTRVTVITDTEKNIKMMCLDDNFMASAAIVDYELSVSMPPGLTSSVGLDALTHAIEAYVSTKANAISDLFALKAAGLIGKNILNAYNNPGDCSAREAMMNGANYAGIAFSNASVCTVHGMSRPIGAYFHVAHGLSNAMLLTVVTRHSISGAALRYAEVARAMGLEGTSDDALCQELLDRLSLFCRDMKVVSPGKYGIDRETYMGLLDDMAKAAIASGSPDNNPKIFTPEELKNMYIEAYDM